MAATTEARWKFVIHGGAWAIPDEAVNDHRNGVRAAAQLAAEQLAAGMAAVDVVENVVALLEDDGTFDAGRGSFLNTAGQVEMDAIIATDALQLASVCAVQNVRNPVRLARRLMDKTRHVVLVGDGCRRFAEEEGFEFCATEELLVGRELQRFRELQSERHFDAKNSFEAAPPVKSNGMGTVGCVAIDVRGNMAAALSTGGTPFKRPGRVGDTPLWGAGCFIERALGGAAATGYGEDLIRVLFARSAVDELRGRDARAAAEAAVRQLGERVRGLGGIILLAPGADGVGIDFNTPRMAFAFGTSEMRDGVACGVERHELQAELKRNQGRL